MLACFALVSWWQLDAVRGRTIWTEYTYYCSNMSTNVQVFSNWVVDEEDTNLSMAGLTRPKLNRLVIRSPWQLGVLCIDAPS